MPLEYDHEEPLDIGRRRRRRRSPRRGRIKARLRKVFKKIGRGIAKGIKRLSKSKLLKAIAPRTARGLALGSKGLRAFKKLRRRQQRFKKVILRKAKKGKAPSARRILRNLKRINKAENRLDLRMHKQDLKDIEKRRKKKYRDRLKMLSLSYESGAITRKEFASAVKLADIEYKRGSLLDKAKGRELEKLDTERKRFKLAARRQIRKLERKGEIKKIVNKKEKIKKLKRGETDMTEFNKVRVVRGQIFKELGA